MGVDEGNLKLVMGVERYTITRQVAVSYSVEIKWKCFVRSRIRIG